MSKYTEDDLREELKTKEYEYGFYTDIESDTFPVGLNEDIISAFSAKKELSTAAWAKQIGLFLGLLLLLFLAIKFINGVFTRLNKRLSKIERTFLNRKGNLLKYFIPGNSSNIFVFLVLRY